MLLKFSVKVSYFNIYEYNLDIIILQSILENNDLGVMFDTTFCFNKYYLNISEKA